MSSFVITGMLECMKFPQFQPTPVQCSLLNYFVPKKHPRRANGYMRGWPDNINYYRERLGKTGGVLYQLARDVDIDHPDILCVFDGAFSLSSEFSQNVLKYSLHAMGTVVNRIPIIKKTLKRLKIDKMVHLLKSPEERDAITLKRYHEFCCIKSKHDNYFLRRKDIWNKLPASFLDYTWNPLGGDYLGFRQMTMTEATGILLKATGSHKTARVVISPVGQDFIYSTVVRHLESIQKPIFDYYWKVVTNDGVCSLGERDSKCYFLIASIRK